ncbi:MAG: P-loop NTPase fold protein, partial [Acidobacteria bacterium]|nr:P-loop NTPase fold protein [Acidobacteriota bacterium]
CAIVGEPGSGKTSFLLKLCNSMKSSAYCDYLQFSFPVEDVDKSKLHFLRKILGSLLNLIANNKQLQNHFEPGDISFETQRLEYSIIIEDHLKAITASEMGVEGGTKSGTLFNLLVPAEFRAKLNARRQKEKGQVEKKDYPIHDEKTLYHTILRLLDRIAEPIVLFIDELDKIGRYPLEFPGWDKEVTKILDLSRDIMLSNKLVLVLSLQDKLYEHLCNARDGQSEASGAAALGLIHAFRKLEGFDLNFAACAVNSSLQYAGYKGKMDDLFEKKNIDIVLSIVKGNPRLFMYHLLELCKKACLENQKQITLDMLHDYFIQIHKIDQPQWEKLVGSVV